MNEFNALRTRARAKRDAAVAEAHKDCEATLLSIAKLEQDLLGKVSNRFRKTSAAIESVIPRDRSFTVHDLLAALEASAPGRTWELRSVNNQITRLRKRGIVQRLKRATIHEPAVYTREAEPAAVNALGDATLAEVIRAVVVRPMNAPQIITAVLDAGYQTSMTRGALLRHVVRALRQGAIVLADGKWTAGE